MGAKGYAVVLAVVVAAVGSMLLAAPASAGQEADSVRGSREDISEWAKRLFGESFDLLEFAHGGKAAVVVIGAPTFGLRTSEVYVFSRRTDGEFDLILTRRRFVGGAGATSTEKGIEVFTEVPVLFVPWTGIGMDSDRVPK